MQELLLSCRQANTIDLVDYLGSLGYRPARVRPPDYWYCSPLREERRPSFKVNRRINRWYDHGLGSGGTLVDFGIRYHGCSIREFLKTLSGSASFPSVTLSCQQEVQQKATEGKIRILSTGPLQAAFLCRYLAGRGISLPVARQYCREVCFSLYNREYWAIGFQNDAGGYELRTPSFKASSSPKTITTQDLGAREVIVLEGFMDFLSFRQHFRDKLASPANFVILNSLAFFERARPFLERHKTIRLWLDRDAAGRRCTQAALSLSSRYRDESGRFAPCKDLNEWLVQRRVKRKSLSP